MLDLNILTNSFIEYIQNASKFNLAIELFITFSLIIVGFILGLKYVKKVYVILGTLLLVVGVTLCIFLDLKILPYIILGVAVVLISLVSVAVSSNLKSIVNVNQKQKSKGTIISQESKDELIDTLIKTVEHLSSRKIGAIITIEKQNMLNAHMANAIIIDAKVSAELLNSIFFPNTSLHDGAVIIRGNRVLCASAYFPSCNKTDVPQSYGTRHRAAIGISEVSDAFTIVVSEETGKIAVTIGGTITGDISLDSLRVSLSQHITAQ
jgi:diadenylate cyclase